MLNTLDKISVAALVLVCATAATGCSEGPFDESAGTAYFSPLETTEVTSDTVPTPTLVPEGEQENVDAVITGFSKNAEAFFERGDPEGRLPAIENLFIASGHYLDLVGIYQNVVEKQGISSDATPRLARAYVRLGQDHKARELLDAMISERGDEASTWFLSGAYWGAKAQKSQEASAKVIAHWQKALELDPDYGGFELDGAPPLRKQLAALRQRTSKEEIEEAVAELEKGLDESATETVADTDTGTKTVANTDTGAVIDTAPDVKPDMKPDMKPDPTEDIETPAEPIAVTLARGQMAMSQGKPEQAKQFFGKALERDPDNVQARLGLIENAWSDESRRSELSRAVRRLAARDDLTPRQQYELGLFSFSKMSANELAVDLWTAAKKRDPSLAEAVGIDALIERAQR